MTQDQSSLYQFPEISGRTCGASSSIKRASEKGTGVRDSGATSSGRWGATDIGGCEDGGMRTARTVVWRLRGCWYGDREGGIG